MFCIRPDKSTFPAMAPAVLSLVMIVIGPCLTCPCQGAVHQESPFADFSDGETDPSPCDCCNACPKKATRNHAGTHPRQIRQSAELIRVPAVTPECPIPGVGFTPVRFILPTPGLETFQVFLE